MKTKSLTLCISFLLLAVFLGSAEAKRIDTTIGAGAGFRQIASASDIFQGGKNLFGEPEGSLKWLMALYGIEDFSELIALIKTADSRDEALAAGEGYENDLSPAGATLLRSSLAGLAHDDRLFAQPAAATIASDGLNSPSAATAGDNSTVQATVPGSPGEISGPAFRDKALAGGEEYEKDYSPAGATLLGSYLASLGHDERLFTQPAAATTKSDGPTSPSAATAGDDSTVQATVSGSPGEKVPATKFEAPAIAFRNPPSTIYITEQSRSKKKEQNPAKAPAATPEKPPHAVKPRPAPDVPPIVLTPAIAAPDFAGPAVVGPEYSGDPLPPTSGLDRVDFPAGGPATSPAPVPEPATMLLFATGIAGLAFGSRRRNKPNDVKTRGEQSVTG